MNRLFYGDNLEILRDHVADASVDLVYIDPPFNSKRDYNVIYDGSTAQAKAFGDTWSLVGVSELEEMIYRTEAQRYAHLHRLLDGLREILFHSPLAADRSMYAYLVNMGIRIVEMHRSLKETGSFYLHCDPTASHYLKLMLDAVFGAKNFRNEIVWHYSGWNAKLDRHFNRRHDSVFFYTKSRESLFLSYLEPWESKEEYLKIRKQKLHREPDGREFVLSDAGGGKRVKRYIEEALQYGKPVSDVWMIDKLNNSSKERLGYPTQKPEALLERIIKASCPLGGVVLDAYCGCGTTIAVAQRLGMSWIGIDITYLAIDLIQQRLVDHFYLEGIEHPTKAQREKAVAEYFKDTRVFGIPQDLESARKLARETKGDYVRKEFEKWAVFSVGGVYSEKRGADGGVDGYFYYYDLDSAGKPHKQKGFIQVKSGKVGVKDIREFDAILSSLDAPLGIFVTLEEPTQPMADFAASLPKFKTALSQKTLDRITVITIEQILTEDVPDFAVRATRQAKAVTEDTEAADWFAEV